MTACAAAAGHTAAARATAAKAGRPAAESAGTSAKPAGTRAAVMMLGRRPSEEAAGRGRIHGMDKGRRGRTAAIAPASAQPAEYHGENNDQDQNIHVCFNLVDRNDFPRAESALCDSPIAVSVRLKKSDLKNSGSRGAHRKRFYLKRVRPLCRVERTAACVIRSGRCQNACGQILSDDDQRRRRGKRRRRPSDRRRSRRDGCHRKNGRCRSSRDASCRKDDRRRSWRDDCRSRRRAGAAVHAPWADAGDEEDGAR